MALVPLLAGWQILSQGRRVAQSASLIARIAWAVAPMLPGALCLAVLGRKPQLERHCGKGIRCACLKLGPAFVKLGQALSSRQDLLPPLLCAELLPLLSTVAYRGECGTLDRSSIATGDGPGLSMIDTNPLASGSVAYVYGGRLRTGERVAVKVVRRWVGQAVRRDLQGIRSILTWLQLLPRYEYVPLVAVIDRLLPVVERQTSMQQEARALRRFRENFPDSSLVSFPYAFDARSSADDVLIMEMVEDAVPLNASNLSDTDYREYAVRLLRALYGMIFYHGFVHCDLHPANILVGRRRLTILDAGLVAELSSVDRRTFRQLFLGIVDGDSRICADAILDCIAHRPKDFRETDFLNDVRRVVTSYHKKSAGDFLVGALVNDIFDIQRRHRLVGSPGFVAAIWALANFEGLVRVRVPDLDFQAEARAFLASAIIDQISVVRTRSA